MRQKNTYTQNRRSSERKKIDKAIFIEAPAQNSTIPAYCIDISNGGMGVLTDYMLHRGLIVKIYFPVEENVMIPIFAEVAWSSAIESGYRNGLCFIH